MERGKHPYQGDQGVGCRSPERPRVNRTLKSTNFDDTGNLAPQGCCERRVAHGKVAIIGYNKRVAPEELRMCGDKRVEMAGRLLLSLDKHLHTHRRFSAKDPDGGRGDHDA
jgi:hypothetical protein